MHAKVGEEGDLARPLIEPEVGRHLLQELEGQGLEQTIQIGRRGKVAMLGKQSTHTQGVNQVRPFFLGNK
jgi:hypothetical protein